MRDHDLDALRALAFLAVFFYHAYPAFELGARGVQVFFVLSSYLITKTILAGTYSIRSFYARRVRRIAPVYYSVLLVVTLLGFFDPSEWMPPATFAAFLVFVVNWWFAMGHSPHNGAVPLWSVSVGLRLSELTGLRWHDVDLEQRIIRVRGQLQWLKPESGGPPRPVWVPSAKTPSGQRLIDLSEELAEVLRRLRKIWLEERRFHRANWHGDEYVFVNTQSHPLRPRDLRRGFKAALKRAGLPLEITLHDLRHCAGSLMLEGGEDIEAVRELLGHSSRSVTERIYAHALRSRKRKAGQSLGYLLRSDQPEDQ